MSGGVRKGELDRYIQVQPVTIVESSSSGQPKKTYPDEDKFYIWGKKMPFRAKEKHDAGREMASIIDKFKVLYDSRLKVSDRLSVDGLLYDVLEVSPMGTRNKELIMLTGEVLESG